jgi:hypothetical protein
VIGSIGIFMPDTLSHGDIVTAIGGHGIQHADMVDGQNFVLVGLEVRRCSSDVHDQSIHLHPHTSFLEDLSDQGFLYGLTVLRAPSGKIYRYRCRAPSL